jgi:hypothetical protein
MMMIKEILLAAFMTVQAPATNNPEVCVSPRTYFTQLAADPAIYAYDSLQGFEVAPFMDAYNKLEPVTAFTATHIMVWHKPNLPAVFVMILKDKCVVDTTLMPIETYERLRKAGGKPA